MSERSTLSGYPEPEPLSGEEVELTIRMTVPGPDTDTIVAALKQAGYRLVSDATIPARFIGQAGAPALRRIIFLRTGVMANTG